MKGDGFFTLVSTSRRVVEGLWATVMLWGLKIRAILSDVPFMYGIVAITLLPSSVSDLSVVIYVVILPAMSEKLEERWSAKLKNTSAA